MRCLVYKKKFEIRTHGRFSFQKLPDDTKHLKQNGAGHSYGTTDMKTPLETSFGLDKSSVVSHSRNDVGRNGTDLKTTESIYQSGIIPLTIFLPITNLLSAPLICLYSYVAYIENNMESGLGLYCLLPFKNLV